MRDLFTLCAGDEALNGVPYIINRHRLHTRALRAGLHLAQEEAGFSCWVTPDGYVLGIIEGIGAILLRACRAKDGNDRDIDGRC